MKIKITQDKERANSIVKMVERRERSLKDLERIKTDSTIIAESYYEVIKELCTAIALLEGYKFVGENAHKELIDFIGKGKNLETFYIQIIQDLRARRNKSAYEGRPIEEIYLESKKETLLKIITKLKGFL